MNAGATGLESDWFASAAGGVEDLFFACAKSKSAMGFPTNGDQPPRPMRHPGGPFHFIILKYSR